MVAPLESNPKALALGHLLNGLKPDIRAEVRLLGMRNLDHAMELAIMAEDKIRLGITNERNKSGPFSTKQQPNPYYPTNFTKYPLNNPYTTTYHPLT